MTGCIALVPFQLATSHASSTSTISDISQRRFITPAAIAGVIRSLMDADEIAMHHVERDDMRLAFNQADPLPTNVTVELGGKRGQAIGDMDLVRRAGREAPQPLGQKFEVARRMAANVG
jgi:hypothetical protein